MLTTTLITLFCFAPATALRLTSSSLGVLHFDLYGHVSSGGTNESVLLQTYLKGCVQRNVAHIRGIAFAFATQRDNFNLGDSGMSQHSAVIGWKPRLTITDVYSTEQHQLWLGDPWQHVEQSQEWEYQMVMPIRFGVSFPATIDSIFEFHVEEWDRYWTFTQHELFDAPQLPAMRPLLAVLPPLAEQRNSRAGAELLALNIMHHVRMGLGVLVYVSKEDAASLQKHPCLKDLLISDVVIMITWIETAQSISHPFLHKSMTWAHAILASWRSSSRLLVIDVDEIITFDSAWSVSTLLANCVGNSSQATLLRMDTACNSCQGSESDAAAFGWLNKEPLGTGSTCDASQLETYGSVLGFQNRWTGKVVVNPNNTHGLAVHTSHVLEGADDVVNQSCAVVMHLVNFWKSRRPYREGAPVYAAL